jgi:Fe-S-cluster containining protein
MSQKRERKKRERSRRLKVAKPNAAGSDRATVEKDLESFSEQAGQAAAPYLQRDDLAASVGALADEVRNLGLRLMEQSPKRGKYDCRPGCAFCCHTSITVAAPEAFAITRYLKDNYPEEVLTRVRRRIEENAESATNMTREDYIAANIPCAMLAEDGNCLVHPVRPIVCAGFLSTSRAKCEAEFKHLVKRDPVPVDKYTMLVGLGVSFGLKDACRKAGLDGNFYELHHALRRVLDTPDAAEEWAHREDIFDGCPL